MAHLKTTPKSPFWFLRYRGPDGVWRERSLRPLRHDTPADGRRARALMFKQSAEEAERAAGPGARGGPGRRRVDASWAWVAPWLDQRYQDGSASRTAARKAWGFLSRYFDEREVNSAAELDRETCQSYVAWRRGSSGAGQNTARLDLIYLRVICEEALRRGLVATNPAARLGVGRARTKLKPELSDEQIGQIRAALVAEPGWMAHAFEVALHQGCRLRETAVPWRAVDAAAGRIHFPDTKGDKPFTAPMHPALASRLDALVEEAKAVGRERIFELPAAAARDFHRLFKRLGLQQQGITFHSTRVTVASRLARGDYSKSKAMAVLNHSSELVHNVYQRLQPADVADAFDVLRIPPAPGGNPSSETQGAPPTS